jgi:hypothetical protein
MNGRWVLYSNITAETADGKALSTYIVDYSRAVVTRTQKDNGPADPAVASAFTGPTDEQLAPCC